MIFFIEHKLKLEQKNKHNIEEVSVTKVNLWAFLFSYFVKKLLQLPQS